MPINPALDSLFNSFWQVYTQSRHTLDKTLPSSLMPMRKQALQAFKKTRLPHEKIEAYRYTPFSQQLSAHFAQGAGLPTAHTHPQLVPKTLQHMDAYHILIYHGQLMPNLALSKSLPSNLQVLPFSKAYPTYHATIDRYFAQLALTTQDSFIALNTMLFDQGSFVYLTPGTQLDKPLMLHHYAQGGPGTTLHPRLLIVLGKHSRLQLIETFCTYEQSSLFMNRVAEVVLEPHAQLDYYHLQTNDPSPALQMHYTHIYQKAASTLYHYTFTLEGRLARNHLEVVLAEPQSKAHLYGMYMGHGNNYLENNTVVDHKAPYTTSDELYKGVASQASTGVFRGSIHVDKSAQKTWASQKHHAQLLDAKASIKAQPRLAIQADDVQCSHGATISQPNEDQLFYLATRGIPQHLGQHILLQGFCQEIINKVNFVPLKEYLDQTLLKAIAHEPKQ